jgi:signal transduction histidine kinase
MASSTHECTIVNKAGKTTRATERAHSSGVGGEAAMWNRVGVTEYKQAEIIQRKVQGDPGLSGQLAFIGRVASDIAHEINNPLTIVIGCSKMLMEKDVPEDIKEDLQVINESAQHVAGIVRRLLASASQSKPGREYAEINTLLSRVLRLRAHEMNIHNVVVMTRLDPDLPWTMVDAGQIQQVFLNIILNAEQAMVKAHNGGHLRVKTEQVGDFIRTTFKDDGIGIAEEDLPKLFDPFFTTKEVGEGMGLGLSISYGIIQEHNGRIYARGRPGKGATFVVELPIVAKTGGLVSPKESAKELA